VRSHVLVGDDQAICSAMVAKPVLDLGIGHRVFPAWAVALVAGLDQVNYVPCELIRSVNQRLTEALC